MSYWITSRNLGALFPPICGTPPRCKSVYVGKSRLRGPYFYNPFELYSQGVLTSPNLMVFGQIGYGKSALVKAILNRHLEIGYRVCILDPKGEYQQLTQMNSGSSFAFGTKKGAGLNPLSFQGGNPSNGDAVHLERLSNLVVTFSAILDRPISSLEEYVIENALSNCENRHNLVDMNDLYQELQYLARSQEGSAENRYYEESDCARSLGIELRRYLFGDLIGIIDGRKADPKANIELGRILNVDLFTASNPGVMAVGVPVFLSLLKNALSKGGHKYLIALDEAWMALSSPGCVGFFRSYWKLARSYGIANIAVVHRSEDLLVPGDQASGGGQIAAGLVSDSQTFIIFHLDPVPARKIGGLLELTETEISLLGTLKRGSCLWKVAGETFIVDVQLTDKERKIFDTDARMV